MNAPLRAASFDYAAPRPLSRPEHLRLAARPARERIAGAAITVLAHIAAVVALILGAQVAKPLIAAKPMMADIVAAKQKPQEIKVALPKFAPPSEIIAPPPLFDIAPSPTTVSAAPPRPATPAATPAPAPAASQGSGQATYLGLLLAQLNRFKHYPPEAKAAHIEGVVMLHFVIDRSGKLLSAEISKSSGRPALDREALALIARTQPLPAMPAEMGGDTLDAIVPINFSLRS